MVCVVLKNYNGHNSVNIVPYHEFATSLINLGQDNEEFKRDDFGNLYDREHVYYCPNVIELHNVNYS